MSDATDVVDISEWKALQGISRHVRDTALEEAAKIAESMPGMHEEMLNAGMAGKRAMSIASKAIARAIRQAMSQPR